MNSPAVQQRLLAQVAPAVKPGGKLLYSVCTLTRAETREVVANFEKESTALPAAAAGRTRSIRLSPPGGPLLLWPQDFGGNGMFIAAWERSA